MKYFRGVDPPNRGGGGNLVWEETCLEKFFTRPILAQPFPSSFTIVAEFFPYFFLDIKFKIRTLCWGGGMIGGGGCRVRYVTWMDGQGSILQGTSGCLQHVVAS